MKLMVATAFALALFATDAKAQMPGVTTIASSVNRLRGGMKDPDSFVLEAVYRGKPNKHGVTDVCFVYRSRNSYGGYGSGYTAMLKNGAFFTIDNSVVGSFADPCRSKNRTDITAEVFAAIKNPPVPKPIFSVMLSAIPPTQPTPEPSPAERAQAAQQYADCLKLAIDNKSVVCSAAK